MKRVGAVALLILASVIALGALGPQAAILQATLRVGTLTLHRCETVAPWCGELVRPLDPTGQIAGTIAIYFEYYPQTARGPRVGALVATEGGPGFPATESRDSYLEFFKPLRANRDVVIMDNRGTGRSGAIDCVPLQTDPTSSEASVASCGQSLGSKARSYSAGYAADDLAAILAALGLGKVDLYGDSYGTFFAQVFALRHPESLRSVILDGAYPLDGPDYAWYPNYAPAMRDKFNLACQRSPACSRLPGSSLDHIAPALESLRREPLSARAPDGDGKERAFTANATQLAIVMFGSAPAYATVREVDAAARAFANGDRLPLLRLMAETQVGVDSRDDSESPEKFSAGLAAAVMCQDAPQIFDMSLDPTQRLAQREQAVAARKRSAADTYAPFTIDEYRGMPLDYAFIDECARWPRVPASAPVTAAFRSSTYPDVPALVISGDLDNMTPVADGTLAAKRFARGRQVIVPNGFHVNALPHARSACPAQIAHRFIETLDVGDTACLQSVPEVRLLPQFARHVREVEPAVALSGNAADAERLRAVSVAVFTVGDVIARIGSNTTGQGVGLRGGTFNVEARKEEHVLTLHDIRWTEDASVSGTVTWPGQVGAGNAQITVAGPDNLGGTLRIQWEEGVPGAKARVTGRLDGVAVSAQTAAP